MTTGTASFSSILVRLPNWLGDALMARPFTFALSHAFPQARVTAVGPAPLLDLLAADGLWERAASLQDPAAALAAVRAERPEAALICPPSFSSAWFAWRSGAHARVGFRGDMRDALLTHAIARPERGELHLSREYLSLLEALGSKLAVEVPRLLPPASALDAARTLSGDGPYAILGPGAVYGPAKRWPAERFAAVARAFRDQGWRVLVSGAQGDLEVCEEVTRLAGDGIVNLAGRTSLVIQTALCANARAVVCNDSGLAHLSAATGAPTVCIFGSTSSAWTAPLGPRVKVIQHPPVCSPCFQRTCRIGYGCLAAVSVSEVVRAAISTASPSVEVA